MEMPKNVGQMDKYARIGIGFLLILLAVMGKVGPWGYIGLLPLLTGVLGTCPAYTLLKMNTTGGKPTA